MTRVVLYVLVVAIVALAVVADATIVWGWSAAESCSHNTFCSDFNEMIRARSTFEYYMCLILTWVVPPLLVDRVVGAMREDAQREY